MKDDSVLKLKSLDESTHYLRAEAPSVVPPTGIDDVEFLMPYPDDRNIFYRSNSRDVIMAGPQIVVGDNGAHIKRIDRIKKRAGLVDMAATTNENQKYLEDFENLNFFEKQQLLSKPSDVNFLNNDVPPVATSASGSE